MGRARLVAGLLLLLFFSVAALATDQPPTAVSVTPSSGSGASQTFALLYSDGNGAANISRAYLLINSALNYAASCSAYYDNVSNSVFLIRDDGTGWLGPQTLGQAGTLQNSQCTLDAGASSALGSGNNLTVNLALTFKPAFSGTKTIFMNVWDSGNLVSDWQTRGSWIPSGAVAPTAVSVTPSSGSGASQTFALLYSDGNGAASISKAYLLINSALNYAASCSAYYDNVSNSVFLIRDDGTGWLGPQTMGQAGTLQNSQCTLDAGASSALRSGNNLTVNLALTFKPAFSGTKTIFMNVWDSGNLVSDWQTRGTWIPSGAVAPTAVSVTPSSGSGASQTFSFLYADGNGFADILRAYVLINTSAAWAGACALYYDNTSNSVYMNQGTGSTFTGPMTIGTAGTLVSSQCTLNVGASSVTKSGNNLTVNLALTFAPSFTGSKTMFMYVEDREALNSASWQGRGTWTPTNTPVAPGAVSVTPNAGSGASQTFSFLYADGNGFADILRAYVLINTSAAWAGTCAMYYDNASNSLYMNQGTGTSFSGPQVIGTAGTLVSSQCTLNVGASSVTKSGNNLTVNLALSFKPAFVGTKTVFMYVEDNENLNSASWQACGSWTVVNAAPTAVSVTPSSGSGASQTFSFLYADGNGFADILRAYVLINTSAAWAGSCAAYYDNATNSLYMNQGTGTSFTGPMTIGTAGTLVSSQCTLNVGASSVTKSGNNLTVNLALTFAPSFTGSKTMFMYVEDNENLNSASWQGRGSWTVPPPPPPTITSITPSTGAGQTITINGTNFGTTANTTVTFPGVATPQTPTTVPSSTQLTVVIPPAATTGTVNIVVTAGGVSSAGFPYTVLATPYISSLTPSSGAVGGTVTINGTRFGTSQGSVSFNGTAATIASPWADTSITVTVPTGATTGPVTLTSFNNLTSNGVPFSVSGVPTPTGISPSSGYVGSTVTVSGSGFGTTQGNSTLSFNGVNATSISDWSGGSITALVPAGATTGPVTVKVAGVTGTGPAFSVLMKAQLTDSLGFTSTYDAAIAGGVWQLTDAQGSGCSSCTQRGVVNNSYDSNGNLLTTTDEAGNTTTYTYDANGNVLTRTQVLNGSSVTWSYTYNNFGEVLTATEPLGHTTTNVYDVKGNLTSTTSPSPDGTQAGSVTSFAYDLKGELTQITDPLNHITTIAYNATGLISSITDAQSNVTTYQYDARGNRTAVIDPVNGAGAPTAFTYDLMDRLTRITYPDSTITSFAYDARGRRTSVTDAKGKVTSYAYDDADRLTSVTDAAQQTTAYAYDTENNLLNITDANGHATSFTYDQFGRVTQTVFPSSSAESYGYDAVGNLTSKTDRKGQLIQYVYDSLYRLTHKGYPDSTGVDYTYDAASRLTQVADPTGSYQFSFDNMRRLTGTTTNYSFLTSRTFTNGYGYDSASNRTSFTDPESGVTSYAYDTLNRVSTLTPPAAISSGSFGFSYDALSRRTQLTRPNSLNTNYGYDNLSRLLSVLHKLGATTIDGATYTVDAVGNRTAKTNQLNAVAENYGYDAIYQLAGVTQGANTTESYTYDPVGNRLSSLGVSPYSYNNSNQLTSTPSATYTYDNNGNTLTKTVGTDVTTYNWDVENRLTSVVLPGSGGTVSFKYDPMGRRIQKSSASGATNYAYDGADIAEEVDAAGSVLARSTMGPGIDQPLAMLRGGTTSYYQADGLGSVTSLTDAAGSIAATYTYDSYGKAVQSGGTLVNPFRYTGREFDSETGLYYYRARYYDPAIGRFIAEDPTGFAGGINRYSYVGNDPLILTDPLGLYSWKEFVAASTNITAGAGDTLSSGVSAYARDQWGDFFYGGTRRVVNKCSKSYTVGIGAGTALSVAIGGAAGAEAAEANAGRRGFEFSHWVPRRWLGPRSIFNGNFVSQKLAYLTDPFRYPAPAGAALRWGPKLNPALQQILRIPWVYDGAAAGAAYGAGGAKAVGDCGCQ